MTPDSTILPGVDGLPWIMGGSVARPGQGARPTFWSSSDGIAWTEHSVDAGFSGSFYGELAGSNKVSALAGSAWDSGSITGALWTSTNRSSWHSVSLPSEFSGYIPVDVAVSGSTVTLVGRNAEGETRGIRINDRGATQFELPPVEAGEELFPSILVARDRQLVLIASPGPAGEPSATVGYTSPDFGETWSPATAIVDHLGSVAGVAVVDDGFVATGGVSREPGDAVTRPAAWFSADGASWDRERVPSPPDGSPLFYAKSINAKFGAPVTNEGVTTAVLWNNNASVSGIYRRTGTGEWEFAGETSVNPGVGVSGFATRINENAIFGVIGEGNYRRIGVLAQSDWDDTRTLSERDDLAWPQLIYTQGGRSLTTLTTYSFQPEGKRRWRTETTVKLAELRDGTLTGVPWSPASAEDLDVVLIGSDETGAEVVLGTNLADGTRIVSGHFRSSAQSDWLPIQGFETAGSTHLFQVAKVGERWIASGQRGEDVWSNRGDGVLWTSTDGVNWVKSATDFTGGEFESAVFEACALPDGTAVAVGRVEESAGNNRPAAWIQSGDSWTRADLGPLGSKDGYIGDCAASAGGVIVTANVDGRSTLQFSSDGTHWTETFRSDRGVVLSDPVALKNGFAASGALRKGDGASPVIWLSPDGKHWSPFSVPSFGGGATSAVAPSGDDLLVTMDARAGQPVFLVRDIEALIPQAPATKQKPPRGDRG